MDLARQTAATGLAAALAGTSGLRLISDPLRRLAYGTDASFYRLTPAVVAWVETEDAVATLLKAAQRWGLPVTFRAAGTSLSGQAVGDGVLAVLAPDAWRGWELSPDRRTVSLEPGLTGAEANRRLAPYGLKIGPDPASIDSAKIGGMVANNASGMCCGVAQNAYHTLVSLRAVLADGTVIDTADKESRRRFQISHNALLEGLADLARRVRATPALAQRIRDKFKIKNTTGYSLNALVDYDDPFDILTHLLVGSEGTLAFLARVDLHTVAEYADKASAFVLFASLTDACAAAARLRSAPVAAVELLDRPALASVAHKPGMPAEAEALGPDGAALLIETRAPDAATLAEQVATLETLLDGLATATRARFTTDPALSKKYWEIRKGAFPSIGGVRPVGTTVIIEDVAVAVEHLAAAARDLQQAMRDHGYPNGVIFGHALEGNLHFVFTQAFDQPEEIERYARFMDAVAAIIVGRYDGSLKAEHGTGRNMAPFVAQEWGDDAYAAMQEIKLLFDPAGLLNPGVILNPDPQAHLRHLKPMPAADGVIDRCIECGFCERMCPSAGLTLTPRQRIVGLRALADHVISETERAGFAQRYRYDGVETCAGCGLCATACPLNIDTGAMIRGQRALSRSAGAQRRAAWLATQIERVSALARAGLGLASQARAVLGPDRLQRWLDAGRRLAGHKPPRIGPSLPGPLRGWTPQDPTPTPDPTWPTEKLVYVATCQTRSFGPAPSDPEQRPLPVVVESVLAKAGFEVIRPEGLGGLCCGLPFASKGLPEAADQAAAAMIAAIRAASGDGAHPIVIDASPCALRLKEQLAGDATLKLWDLVGFLHDAALPRLEITPQAGAVALHPVCSLRKQGEDGKLAALARACSDRAVQAESVTCCGWAGDKGFFTPELNAHALRRLRDELGDGCREGVSSSRSCEIGLSEQAQIPFRHIAYLLDRVSRPKARPPAF